MKNNLFNAVIIAGIAQLTVTPAMAQWLPAGDQLAVKQQRAAFDRINRQINVIVTITNNGDEIADAPLRLQIDNSTHEVTNAQQAGDTTFIPLSNNRLAPGESIRIPVQLAFAPKRLILNVSLMKESGPGDNWTLVWQDEFSAPHIDTNKWSFEENCWGGGNNEQQCYTAREQNAFIEDGKLIIQAQREDFTGADNPDGNTQSQRTLPYTSARLRSIDKGDWTYGRFEINAKLPFGQGTWPAIWMLPSDYIYGSWAASGEIDIMEAVNLKASSDDPATPDTEENRVHGTLHYGRQWPGNVYSGAAYRLPGGRNPADGFHEYAVEWEEGEIRWYVDNVHYATQTSDGWYSQYQDETGQWVTAPSAAPFNERFHLLLNLAVGGAWAANVNEGGIDESVFPQRMEVDYVRVYECSVNPVSGQGCATVGDDAQQVPGHPPPDVSPQTRVTGPQWMLFKDELTTGFTLDSYNPAQTVTYSLTDSPDSPALRISQTGTTGNVFITAPEPVDLSDFAEVGVISFDIKVLENAAGSDLLVKTDSGWPAVADTLITVPASEQWQSVNIDIRQLLTNGNRYAPGNTADIRSIVNPLVFEPTGPMSFMVDNIRYQFDLSDKQQVTVFDEGAVAPFAAGSYAASGQIDISTPVSDDAAHGVVSELAFNTNESVVYFQASEDSSGAPTQFDIRQLNFVEFDLKVVEDPRENQDFVIKMDCGHPCGSGDFPITTPQTGVWTHYKISLNDLLLHPGSTLDLSKVDTPLVIFPAWGNQQGVIMQVDNIRLTQGDEASPAPPDQVEVMPPFTLFGDTLAPYWSLWDCCGNAQVTLHQADSNQTIILDYFGPAPTVAGIQTALPHNLSAGQIETIRFDFRMLSAPNDPSASILVKIEANDGSYAQLSLADYASGPVADGQWQTIVIPRDELIAQGLNVENINLFLVFPEWNKATGAVLELDNIVVE